MPSVESPASFGLWLRLRRKALDLTQEELAQRVGCSVSAIRKIESDERRPSRQIADLLAGCLEVPEGERGLFVKIARGERRADHLPPLPAVDAPPLSSLQPGGNGEPVSPANASGETGRLAVSAADLVSYASNLPHPATPLVGREAERAEVARLLCSPECRLLTLTGPGGIGKTRLALQVASDFALEADQAQDECGKRFENGVFFVSLAPVVSPEFIVPAIAEAVGLTFYGQEDLQVQLLAYLRDKAVLLVLDNLEHLLQQGQGVENLVELLHQVRRLKLLVTSIERLNVQGEWVFEIQGLPVPPAQPQAGLGSGLAGGLPVEAYSAVALFLQSARQVRPSFNLAEENRADIIRICQLMEGMPLGIELAASWVRVLSCHEIVEEMERSLDFLAANVRGQPERHRSVRAAFNHSWELLTDSERHTLSTLSVFRGGFRRNAAGDVAQAHLGTLSALVDKSLLRRSAGNRYDMQEMVRQYAAERLEQAGETAAARTRHLAYYLALAERIEPELRRWQQVSWLDELSEEHNNLRVALEWSLQNAPLAELGLRLSGALWRFWVTRGYLSEGREWLVRTLKHAPDVPAQLRGDVLNGAGLIAWRQGDYALAYSLTQECVELHRSAANEIGVAHAQALLGLLSLREGDVDGARQMMQESINIFRRQQDTVGLALALNSLGEIARHQGEVQRAAELYRESLELYRQLGHKRGQADLLHNLGYVAFHQGDNEQAANLFRESLDLELEQGNRRGMAECLIGLATVLSRQEQTDRAATLFAAAEAQLRELGAVLEPTDQAEYERSLAAARAQIEDTLWQEAWQNGSRLSPALAIAYALSP